jgi:hypothetical protein
MKPQKLSPLHRRLIRAHPSTHQAKRNSGGTALVPMVQFTDLRQLYHSAKFLRVNCSRLRGIFLDGQMRSRPLVVVKIGVQDFSQRGLVEHDHVVQSFSSDRSNQPFDIAVLPGRTKNKWTETSSWTWFFENARHDCEGGLRCRTMYLATVVSERSIPSFNNSP